MSGNVHCLTRWILSATKEAEGPISIEVVWNSLCVIIVGGMHRHAAPASRKNTSLCQRQHGRAQAQKVLGLLGSCLSEILRQMALA